MRVFLIAAALAAFLSGAAHAQSQSIPKYGEEDKTKSPAEIGETVVAAMGVAAKA